MDTENVPTTPETPVNAETPVVEKKKFWHNPKVVVGVVTGFVAAGAAIAIAGLKRNGSDSETDVAPVEDDLVVETFDPIDTPPID
jgi:aspartokinase